MHKIFGNENKHLNFSTVKNLEENPDILKCNISLSLYDKFEYCRLNQLKVLSYCCNE